MPERKLDNWITSYLKYTDNTEPPELFREWCAVSTIAAALQRKAWLEWGTVTFYPNLYVVLVAPAGKARKGTAMAPARKFIDKLGVPLSAESITREALIRTMKESETGTPDPSTKTLLTHSSLTVFSPELTVFLGYNNNTLLSDLTDFFDCSKLWTYRTKNSGEDKIAGVWVNMLGATTPDLIRTTMPLDAIGGGLTSRIVFVYEEKKGKTVPLPFLSAEDKVLEEKLYYDLEDIHQQVGMFKVSKDFISLWVDWYTSNDGLSPFNGPNSRVFDGYVERRPTQILKLSMIMCAARTREMALESCDLLSAINLLERTEVKMHNVFGGVGLSKSAALTNSVLISIGKHPWLTANELLRDHLYDAETSEMREALSALLRTGIIQEVVCADNQRRLALKNEPSKFDGS